MIGNKLIGEFIIDTVMESALLNKNSLYLIIINDNYTQLTIPPQENQIELVRRIEKEGRNDLFTIRPKILS